MHRTETDGELVAAVLAGDRRSFTPLVERHVGPVTARVGRLLGSSDETEDVVQEATLQAYLRLRELRDPTRFGAWFAAIAANLAKMRLRERGRLVPLESTEVLVAEDGIESKARLDALHHALADLAPREREAVLLHYLGGLSTPEIAERGGEATGTVRVRLYRARRRLQEVLAAFTPQTRKEMLMIEVDIRDVVVRVAENGEPRLAMPSRIVLLGEKGGDRLLPIWVGAPEGDALALHLVQATTPRPMTIDLMARLLEAMGGRVERIAVSSLREETFYAVVYVANGATREVDARPSDGINLAVRVGAPIFVDAEVLDSAGFPASDRDGLERELNERCVKYGDPAPAGKWRSLTPDLIPWYPPRGK